jgi:hypothetical protein
MFEKSWTWRRYSGESTKVIRLHLGHVPQLDERPGEESISLRIALSVALLVHVVFLLVQLPRAAAPSWSPAKPKVYLVNQVRSSFSFPALPHRVGRRPSLRSIW